MSDVNVNAPAEQAPVMAPPARTDDQILPRIRWVPIGKSNCYLDVERSQSNPIYKIAVDILKHTKFFRAFTASLTIPLIYIQQFLRTPFKYDNKTGNYSCQLDEQWFDLTKDTLRETTVQSLQSDHPTMHFLPHQLLMLLSKPVLRYLKFSDKGTKQEVFGMPILNDLITDDIRGKQYYNAYLEKVAKHQRYLAGEKEKKRKLVTETSEAHLQPNDPKLEPKISDEEVDLQKAVEESLKEFHSACQGPLPPVVIREPESGKFQPLPEVQGKGKEKVNDEQVALDLFTLQTPKKRSPADHETDSDEEVSGIDAGVQDEGQAGPNPGEQDEGQAGPNPDGCSPLRDRFRDFPEADMKEILHHRMWESNSYQAHKDHKMLYKALEKSMARDHTDQLLIDLAEVRRKKKKRRNSPKTPPGSPSHQPPPPPPAGSSGTLGASGSSRSSQLPPPHPPPPPSTNQRDQSTGTDAPSSSKTVASARISSKTYN
ncbi:E-beta-farnesene synthase [Tanacetum coccineum]